MWGFFFAQIFQTIILIFEAMNLFDHFRLICLVKFGFDLIVAWFWIFKKRKNNFGLKFVVLQRFVAVAFRSLLRLIVFRHRGRMNVIDPFNASYFDQNVLCCKGLNKVELTLMIKSDLR